MKYEITVWNNNTSTMDIVKTCFSLTDTMVEFANYVAVLCNDRDNTALDYLTVHAYDEIDGYYTEICRWERDPKGSYFVGHVYQCEEHRKAMEDAERRGVTLYGWRGMS